MKLNLTCIPMIIVYPSIVLDGHIVRLKIFTDLNHLTWWTTASQITWQPPKVIIIRRLKTENLCPPINMFGELASWLPCVGHQWGCGPRVAACRHKLELRCTVNPNTSPMSRACISAGNFCHPPFLHFQISCGGSHAVLCH